MKTLKDHTILYDSECPLCNAYTSAFIKTGMLDENGRTQYSIAIGEQWARNVDPVRARNEIALVNRKDQTVDYGLESLFKIFAFNMPLLKPVLALEPFKYLVWKLYYFISYNRKVIAPGKAFERSDSCTPEMNYTYRWMYITFAWIVTSSILVGYVKLLTPLIPPSSFIREFLICGGQILFQGAIVYFIRKDRIIHYLGNMMTVSFIGALLLVPMLILKSVIHAPWIFIVYFVLVVSFMLFEHSRRVRILELPWILSGTWMLYRFIVLAVILIKTHEDNNIGRREWISWNVCIDALSKHRI